MLSQTGTAIVGNNVTIDAGVGTSDINQSHKVSQGGSTWASVARRPTP
ncbi:hypothetical protein ISP15_16100 [Dyella jejuensis]|uniref:Uncharacterized protein n=1 Tax=Dyella jejuensis TaxID=1432009 RepID=A0ABW8JL61_9GAMM